MSIEIGQYRFSSVNDLRDNLTDTMTIVQTGVGQNQDKKYKDFKLVCTDKFQKGQDYYLSLGIPRSSNYNFEFDIRLTNQDSQNSSDYQYLRKFSVDIEQNSSNVYNIVLYEASDNKVKASVKNEYKTGMIMNQNEIYYDEGKKIYYIGDGTANKNPVKYVDGMQAANDISVVADWVADTSTSLAYINILFRPVVSDFDTISVDIIRNAIDYNIQNSDDTIGRFVDTTKVDFKFYRFKNLVTKTDTQNGVLKSIGVWSHPNLLMSINGEEISVGPSGYYELNNILDITSVAVLADGYQDNFTMDYTYEKDS